MTSPGILPGDTPRDQYGGGNTPPPATPPSVPPPPPVDPLTGTQRNAYNYLTAMFEDLGLGTLAPKILEMLQRGLDETSVSYELQQTPEYKDRFKANEARRRQGLPVLSPKEYLDTERAYRSIMQSAGVAPGFWDTQDDFTKFLENDVAPAEVKERVDMATGKANAMDDATKDTLWRDYGLSPNDLAMYFLDDKRALPELEKISKGMDIGAAARRQGLTVGVDRAQQLGQTNLAGNADQVYGQVAQNTQDGQRIAQVYGETYDQKTAEDEAFLGLESAKRKRKTLSEKEQASFTGSGGVGKGSLAGSGQY